MALTLSKLPLSTRGVPLRPCDPVSGSCVVGVHTGFEHKRTPYGYVPPCDGHALFNGRYRACMCNCHTERKGK